MAWRRGGDETKKKKEKVRKIIEMKSKIRGRLDDADVDKFRIDNFLLIFCVILYFIFVPQTVILNLYLYLYNIYLCLCFITIFYEQ